MTIYNLEVNATNLSRIKSAKVVRKLCGRICNSMFQHFANIMAHSPEAQVTIAGYHAMLNWYMCILKRATPEETDDVAPLIVCKMYVEKHDPSPAKDYKQVFCLLSLQSVSPSILIEVMYQLLRDSLKSIAPVTLMTEEQFYCWTQKILAITRDLSLLNGVTPVMDDPNRKDFTSFMLDFELKNEPGIIDLF